MNAIEPKPIVDQRRRRGGYRRWSEAQKHQIVAETRVPGMSVSIVARRHDVNANQLFQWRRKFEAEGGAIALAGFVPVKVADGTDKKCGALGLITIELRNGILVRIDRDFDERALQRVLSTVGTQP